MIYIFMTGAILWFFIDNHFVKKQTEQLKDRVRTLEFITSPMEENK